MWIIPKTYPTFSHFAPDMVESSEDLKQFSEQFESSLMWRSKPTRLQTWSQRWKRVKWFRRLCGRILKPSARRSFETALISSLADIRANRSPLPAKEKGLKILGTSGHGSDQQSRSSDRQSVSLKTLKDTSVSDSGKSLPIWLSSDTGWKAIVANQRGDYSRRLKSELRIRGKECLSWPTITQQCDMEKNGPNGNQGVFLLGAVKGWTTPCADDTSTRKKKYAQGGTALSMQAKESAWPTPASRDYKGANGPDHMKKERPHMGQLPNAVLYGQPDQGNHNTNGKNRGWLTPKDPSGGGQSKRTTPGGGLRKLEDQTEPMDRSAHLNPNWVEQLMGLPTGWTGLDSWGME